MKLRSFSGILFVTLIFAPALVCAGEQNKLNPSSIEALEQAANLGDPNAAVLVATEQAANLGDSNEAMLFAAEELANIGSLTATNVNGIEQTATYDDPEEAAPSCHFEPC